MDHADYLRKLELLVDTDSGSGDAEGVGEVARRLAQWYREAGWHTTAVKLDEACGPLLIVENHPGAAHYDAMFVGHMDTVFPRGTAQRRPFSRRGDRCYGPGVEDMKSGDAAMLAIAAGISRKATEKLNILMCHNPDEEIGSIYSAAKMDEYGAKADRIFVMESAQKGYAHCFQRKGRTDVTVRFHGIAGHAGFVFQVRTASAVSAMAQFITALDQLADRGKETSVNVGLVTGGTAVNVVADEAELSAEIRYWTDAEQQRIEQAVKRLAAHPGVDGVSAEITRWRVQPAWDQTPQGLAYIEQVKAKAAELGIAFDSRRRGGLSDANHLCRVCPVILDGMGPVGEFGHSEKETLYLDTVDDCVRLHIALLEELAQ